MFQRIITIISTLLLVAAAYTAVPNIEQAVPDTPVIHLNNKVGKSISNGPKVAIGGGSSAIDTANKINQGLSAGVQLVDTMINAANVKVREIKQARDAYSAPAAVPATGTGATLLAPNTLRWKATKQSEVKDDIVISPATVPTRKTNLRLGAWE